MHVNKLMLIITKKLQKILQHASFFQNDIRKLLISTKQKVQKEFFFFFFFVCYCGLSVPLINLKSTLK